MRYADLVERQQKQAEAERLGAIPYDAEIHKRDPFVTGARGEQNRLLQDPVKAEVYQRESKPIELPWSPVLHRTILNRALVESPEIGKAMSIAADLAQVCRQRELEAVQQQEQKARQRAEELKAAARKFQPTPQRVLGALR